jgi:hypothetical protein
MPNKGTGKTSPKSSSSATPVHAPKRRDVRQFSSEVDSKTLKSLRFKHVGEFFDDYPDDLYN